MNGCRARRIAAACIICILALSVPALAGTRIEREFEIGSGGKFVLNTDSGSVEVAGVSGDTALVVITSREDDLEKYYALEFEHEPGLVHINVDKKGRLSSWFRGDRGLRFEIRLPHRTEVEIDTSGGSIEVESIESACRLDTSGGAIRAREIGADILADTSGGSIAIQAVDGNVNADTSGGGIQVQDVRGDVRADTSGGSIRIEDVDGGILADTSGGSIRIHGAGGHVRADTSGGGVSVGFAPGNSSGGEISTSGGGVTVTVDPAANLDIDAASSGGSVSSDLPVTVRGKISKTALQGTLNGGGATLRLRSSGGPVRIESH